MKILITGFAVLLSIAQAVAQPARGGAINNPPGSGSGSSSGPFTNASIYGLTVIGNETITGNVIIGGTITVNGSGITNIQEGALNYYNTNPPAGEILVSTGSNNPIWLPPSALNLSGGSTLKGTNSVGYARWERQEPTSQDTNFVISVTNYTGNFMSHYIQIVATNSVMLHPDCYTNAILGLEVIASGAARRVSFSTNLALLNTTGLTLQSTGGTNWFVDVSQNGMFIASVKTNEYFGRRVMTWRTNVW